MSIDSPEVLVIGCGNLLRTDDGVGPTVIRRLRERGLPAGVEAVDGGTAGMDVVSRMRRVPRVIFVDACMGGGVPGTILEVDVREVETPPLKDVGNMHHFRWDHAVSFARWLLTDEFPDSVTAFLIEAESMAPGLDLSETVAEAADQLVERLAERWATGRS